jgi:hypothetical protein
MYAKNVKFPQRQADKLLMLMPALFSRLQLRAKRGRLSAAPYITTNCVSLT